MKEIDIAKKNYREDKNIKRVSVAPLELKGVGKSESIFVVNGQKCIIGEVGNKANYVFVPL